MCFDKNVNSRKFTGTWTLHHGTRFSMDYRIYHGLSRNEIDTFECGQAFQVILLFLGVSLATMIGSPLWSSHCFSFLIVKQVPADLDLKLPIKTGVRKPCLDGVCNDGGNPNIHPNLCCNSEVFPFSLMPHVHAHPATQNPLVTLAWDPINGTNT